MATGSGMTEERGAPIERRGVRIVDTFAEAFDMRAARVLITAYSAAWARIAAQSMTGFATSVIGCKVEAGIECELSARRDARWASRHQRSVVRVRCARSRDTAARSRWADRADLSDHCLL